MYRTNTVSTQQGGDGGMQENQPKKAWMDPKMIFCVGTTKGDSSCKAPEPTKKYHKSINDS